MRQIFAFTVSVVTCVERHVTCLFGNRGHRSSLHCYYVALGVALTLTACHRQQAPVAAPRLVVAVAVKRDGDSAAVSLPAQIEARYATPLSFRVAGMIVDRRVRLGDTVKKGELLATLDPAGETRRTQSARAQLDYASDQLRYAKQQLDRDQQQEQHQLISRMQLEQTQNAYASALAQRDQAQANAALAEDQLKYTRLVADRDGVVTSERAHTGENVEAGQVVYDVAWTGQTDAVVDVPESLLNSVRLGQRAKVSLPYTRKTLAATVREISPAADPHSRTFRIRLTLQSPDTDVHFGMTANVAFNAQARSQGLFTLPSTALFHDGQHPAVWVVGNDNRLELRQVFVSQYGENTIAVSGGLKAGERVVWQGAHTVTAGEKVEVVAPLHPEDMS